jgi:predicted phosphoribosyltransferase
MTADHWIFLDRYDAGRQLAARLTAYVNRPDVLVLALPRGGVPVGFEVARALHAPLDVMLVRKLGVPGYPELAMGAIAPGAARVLNDEIIRALNISDADLKAVIADEERELARRERVFRGGRHAPTVRDRTVIAVDDGLATGATMRAAVSALQAQQPARLVIAIPVGVQDACDDLRPIVDELVCLAFPVPFLGISAWYQDFGQTSDSEVSALLAAAE